MTSEPGVDQADQAIHIAEAYFETENYERGREVLRRSLSQHPDDPGLLAQHARAEYLLENYDGASRSAYAALSAAPQHELAMRIYALSLDGLGRHGDALWMAWQGVKTHPNEPLQHRVYARLLQKSRQLNSALVVVDEALRLDPTSPDGLVLRGSILHDMGRIAESTDSYRQALALDANHAAALNNMAVNRLQRGKFGHALRGFLGAAGSDPGLGDLVRRNIGAVLAKMLRRLTVVATVLAVLIQFVGFNHYDGHPTVILRTATGVLTAALIVILARLLYAIPRRVLVSVLRERGFVVARLVHALLVITLGAAVTAFGGFAWTVAVSGILTIAGLVLTRVGLTIGR
jgi:tetratricopeptide (TPR) repeat protein